MADAPNNWVKLLQCFLGPVQDLENAFQQLLVDRTVDRAYGVQLDVIGRIVGQLRAGMADDVYRRYIRARISVNRSKGTVADVLKVADLVVFDDDAYMHAIQYGTAGLHLVIEDVVIDDADLITALVLMLRDTVSAGVRIVVETWPLDEVDMFVLDDELGTIDASEGKGWGDEITPADGGGLAGAAA